MQLHTLKPKTSLSSKKRVGRGGKRGTYSGRGQKGQKSRAGHNILSAERQLISRTPKLRGFANKRKSPSAVVVGLSALNALSAKEITLATLVAAGVVSAKEKRVKIVANGKVTSPKDVVGIPVSASARTKIESAGGSVRA